MTRHVMIDLETMDTKPSALILSVGLVVFDDTSELASGHWIADPGTQIGRTVSSETAFWWMTRTAEARGLLSSDNRVALGGILGSLLAFVGKEDFVWANGPMFDIAILENAYAQQKIAEPPWVFRNVRCFRTLMDTAGVNANDIPRVGEAHNALDDARWQVAAVQECWRKLADNGR